ncbi:MAG: anhydro-N-acetylmuramic acid kinase [Rhizobiales bacterium]|nr:anhydro-N-acetylmuramic acid kinase [Hyphomicrobiales bacterium]
MSKTMRTMGLMSGTSLDGIDVALIETDGDDVVRRGASRTFAYSEEQRQLLRRALEEAKLAVSRDDRHGVLGEAEDSLTRWHADAARNFAKEEALEMDDVGVIGFHGQTVIHRPEKRLTMQLGDGKTLARELGVRVVYDMRAADVAAGGQGAPLVPVYHRALAKAVTHRPLAFVNIGGVANITWIGSDGDLAAFDTGPGNALIDDWMKRKTGVARDEGGRSAAKGRIDEGIAAQFLGDSYFEERGPKSLDRNTFAGIALDSLSVEDGAATLTAVTVRAIAMARENVPEDPQAWIFCGGGRHNSAIMAGLEQLLPRVMKAEACGFNGDSMEAEAWAYLAVRSLRGLPLSYPGTTGVPQPIAGGVIAEP